MAFASGGAGRGARPSSHSGSSATTSKASTGRVRSTPSSSSRPVPASAAARVRPSQTRSGARSGSSGAGSHAYAAEHAASRSRSPEAAAIVEAVPVQELSDRIAAQLTSKKLVQESDLEDLKFHVMTILQPALKKTSYEEVQRLTVELTEARTRTAAARSEISRLRSEAQLLEQKSAEADEKSRRAETRATKAENRLKSSLQDPMTFKLGSETVEVRPTTAKAKDTVGPLPEARGSVTGGAPGAHSPRRSITSGQLSIGGGGSPEPSEVGEGGEDAGHRAQRLLEKQRKKEEADAARRAAEERMKDQKKKKQEEKSNKEQLQAMKEMGEELKKAKAAAKDAETQASQMRIKLEQAEAGAKSAEKARSNAEKKLSSAEQELRSLRNDPVFDQVNMLRDGVRNLEKEVDELQQQVAEKEELLSAAYEAKALTEKERGEEISALKEDISRMQSGSDQGQELKRLQEELDAARAETVRLQATAESSKAVEGGTGSGDAEELRKLREELASTRAELASLKASPAQAPGAEKATPEATPSPEAEKAQEELRKLREELASSQAEVSRLRSLPPEGGEKAQEWHDLQEELAAAKAEAARLKAQGASSSAVSTEDVQKLKQELAASQAEVARLRSLPPEGGEQAQEWHKLQEELTTAKVEAARLKAEGAASSAAATEEAQKLKQELEAAKAEAARSKAEPGAAGGQAEELAAARSKAEPGAAGGQTEEVRKLQEELAAAKAQVELLRSSTPGGEEVLKLQEELRKLREEQATRQSEQSSSRQEAAETPEDVLKLQEELKSARAEIAQLKSQAPSQPEKLEELRGEMAAPPAATETVTSVEVGPAPATEEAAAPAATAPVAAAPAAAGPAPSSEAAEKAASGGAPVLGSGEGAATASAEEIRKLKEELTKTKKELLEAQAGAEAASKKAEELGGLQQELEALRAEKDASVKEQEELKRQLNESNLATKRAEREKREAIAEAERLDALEDEQQRADLEAEKEQARKEQEEKAQKQAEEHEAERKKLQEEERKKRVEAKQHFEAEKARIREEETEKNQKKARDIADQMEKEYTNSLLSGVWEAWEHAFRQGSAEHKKAEAKAEIERLRKEELLKGEVSKAQIADQMYAQYCRELLDGVFELWRDAFKEEKGKKAADAARLKMEQEMHRFKQAEHDKAFNTAKQIAEQMYKKYCNGLFDEIVAVWKEETMKTKKEKEERTKKAQEEGRIKAQQEKDLREAEVLAERMRKTLQNDDVKFCFDFWVSDYRAEGQRRRDEEAKKKHEAELAALKRMEQETGERAALQIAQKMYKKIVDDNMKWCVDNWHRIIKKEKAQKKEEQAKRQHQDELDRIRREELEKKDKAAQKLAEQMFKKYWDDNIGVVVELWRRLAVLTKETKARRQHEEELARLKRSHKEVGTKAALEIAGRMSKAHCDSLLKMSISSWRVWTHQTQSSRKEEEAKKKYEQDMARIRRLEVEKADKAAEVAGLNMFRKVMNDNLGLIVSEWKDFTKNELLHRKLEKDMRDTKNHIDSLKKEARAKGERVRHLVAQNLLAKDKKEVLSDAFAKWVINWRQHLLEQQQHAERIQHRDQVEKMKRSEAERMQKMKGLMASQFNSTGNRSLLHLCVNNWRLVWEAAIAERQQNQAVEQLTGKLRQMDKQKNEMINRTKDKIFLAFAGRQRAELLSVVFTAWKADAKEEHLLRRKEELASSYEKDIRVMHKKQKDMEALAREKMVKGTLSQMTGATLSVCLLQWRSYTKDCKRERSEAEMRDQLQEEIRRQKREAEKLNDAKSRQIALNMVSFERNSTLSVCVVAWRQATQASKREADEALGRQKAQQEYTQLKLEKDKAMNVTRDRMAVRLLGHQQTHLLSVVFTLWRGAAKEEKMSRQQADKDRANKIELARLDGLRREAAKMKAHSIAARFFQKHHESLLAEMFIQFRKSVEIQIEERKVEEAKRQHEEDRRKMEQRHNDRRAKFIAQSVQGKERMMLLSIVKRCLVAWSQQVVESQMELMRSEAQEKHSTEMNEVKSQLRDHSKKNGVYAALSHELANHQFLLQRMLGVWREFRAEQAVHRAYQAKIAELNVQFEDDLAELMHVQGMKMYNLRLALADLKASSERKLLFQYCMQKWDECKYQRSLENELAQINERHEDELAELVHAQGLAKHRMIQTSQDRFLKGVMRQELQRHFLAWSHVKRLNISTAAELLTVAKAKQQLGKEMEVKDLKALRLKDHVVHHVSKTITFVRLKDIWLAWLHQVLLHRLEKTQDRKDRSHRKEIQRIRREAADEHTALGERMHSELEQVGRESHLRDMLLQWQAVVKNMRSHRNYHGEMDQIRQEAAQEVKQKEKKTVEQLSSFAIHSAELLIRRRMKEPLVMVFVNWRMVQEREKYQQHAARMQQEAQDQRDHHQNVLQSKETKKEVACWQLATFSYLVRERVIIRLAIFHYWREASMWSKKAHLHHLRRQGQEIASHSKEVSLLVTQMLAHQRDLSLLTKVMVQWKQVVEREANQRSLEHKDEENVERVKTSVHNERVAGSKRAQVLVKWLLHLELQNQAKWLAAWSGEVKYAKIVRKMEGDKEAHDLAMVEVENKMEKHQDALVPYWLRLKRQMVLMRYFPAFIFMPYMNHSEAHLQKTIEKLDKKRERQIADLYKLRRKSVADAGEVLHVFRGQRENQLILSLVLVIWSEVISDQMAMRRWNEQREVKLELERSLQELKDKTWHLRIDTKKGKDLTDTCRHMGEWTGQLLMELSTTRAWGCWRIWHLQEVHSRVQAKANNHTEARVMAERMKVQQRQKKDEVVMSNIMVAAGEVSSVKFSFRAWEILTRKEKEHRHKTNMRQDHKKELYELRQDTVAKLRASNSRENDMKDMQQVLRCFVCWCTDVKAGKMATDLLVAEEKKRQEVEAQMQQVQQDLTVEMSARKTAESEARTATELLHNNGIQFPTEPEAAAAARPERFMLPVERVAQALQKVYRRRLTTALVAMLTTSPRKMAWYSREPGDRPALADNPKAKRKAQSTAKPAASKAAAPAMLALPAPAATPGAPGGVASTLDFLARTRQLVASSFDADAMAPGGRDTDDGFGRQGNGYPVPSLPRFGAHDAQVPPPESPGAFERPRMVAKPRPDSAGPHLVITGVKSPPAPPPSTAAGPTLPTRQTIEQQINLQDTLTHMQDTMRRMDDVEPKVSQ